MRLLSTRFLSPISNLANVTVGIQHSSGNGLSWLIGGKRGDVNFIIPLLISKSSFVADRFYVFKVLYGSFVSLTVDLIIREAISWAKDHALLGGGRPNTEEMESLQREHQLLETTKSKAEAERQVLLMTKQALNRQNSEQKKNGLIILQAIYYDTSTDTAAGISVECVGPPELSNSSLDATIQLQFWVVDSTLRLPSSTKSGMLGFYDLTTVTDTPVLEKADDSTSIPKTLSVMEMMRQLCYGEKMTDTGTATNQQPLLYIQYSFGGKVFELTVQDDEAVALPSPLAKQIDA